MCLSRKIIFIVSLLVYFSTGCKKNSEGIAPEETAFKFETPEHFGVRFVIPSNNPMSKEGVALGRMLFYEKKLSKDNTISCASCHQQSKAFTDGLAFAKGIKGQQLPRGSMSLANLLWVDKFFWDGRSKSLEEQALLPIQNPLEMDLSLSEAVSKLQNTDNYPAKFKAAFGTETISSENIAKALAQFQRTLISSNSRFDKIVRGEIKATAEEQRAISLFFTHPIPESNIRGGNCGDCHGSNLTTLNTLHDNGLNVVPTDLGLGAVTGKSTDNGKMKAPSLRNIALTAPYMHNGKFTTLEEVLNHYNEHIQLSSNLDPLIIEATNTVGGKTLLLTEQEKKDIILFLKMLTDEDFITNKEFSNPF